MTPTARRQMRSVTLAIALATTLVPATPAFAQLDPLLFVKRLPPNVIVVVDTSLPMLEDGEGNFYDPNTYLVADDPQVAREMGADVSAARHYRRIYDGLRMEWPVTPNRKYTASTITAVDETTGGYASFWNPTRLEIAKAGITQAVHDNRGIGDRWALVGLRQRNPRWRLLPDCDRPVRVTTDKGLKTIGDVTPCDASAPGRYGLYAPAVDAANFSLRSSNGVRLPYGSVSASDVIDLVERPINDPLGLIPAGRDSRFYVDRPITFALEDALVQAKAAMAADPGGIECRNTIVVLVTGGADSGNTGYLRSNDAADTAAAFLSVPAGGTARRVPIYVAAIRPESGEKSLAKITSRSGGRYFNVSDATDVSRVINLAIQAGYARSTDFNLGVPSEYQPVSPVVGTVDLTSARSSSGRALRDTVVYSQGQTIPQRGNLMVTAGFELNGTGDAGMEGVVRAFRTFRPDRNDNKPGGYAFVSDGTALWPDVDGRRETRGRARTPRDSDDRNIFTYVPGRGTVAFTLDSAPALAPHLGGADADALIPFIRNQPLGPVIGSTPAIVDPPSLEPPPDNEYGRRDVPGTYAGDLAERRSIIWVGGNNGMIHAIDARTGFEVWAFIPYNLLPKLRTLMDGQSVETFDYFVDSSPKIAEVKLDGQWRTVLVIGQAYGGTFYQAFDITDAGMLGPPPSSDDHAGVLASFDDPNHIPLLWSFPRYDEFDPTVSETFTLTDGFPGGEIRFFGDLRSSATPAEKSVGFTWSVPAIAPLDANHSVTAAIVGSGYFPAVEARLPGRGAGAPVAGQSLYLIDVETGRLVGGSSACGGSGSVGCVDVGDVGGNGRKNAVQADPAAAGKTFSPQVATAAYLGDIDGIYHRFDLAPTGQITFSTMVDAGAPIYMASSVSVDASGAPYTFFGTGSDLLPVSSSGGALTTRAYGLRDNIGGGGASVSFVRDLDEGATLERLSSAPVVAGQTVFFTTVLEDPRQPCADVTSRLYGLSYLGGAAYDTNGDGSVGAGENPVIATVDGRATAPFVADGHLYFGTSGRDGSNVEMFGDPESFNNGISQTGVRLLSWRGTQ